MTTPDTYFARRCDISGEGINQGYVWRTGDAVTALGSPSEQQALINGYGSLKEALNDNAATFMVWLEPGDVRYQQAADGSLQSIDGIAVPTTRKDTLDKVATVMCTTLGQLDRETLVQCMAFGAAVMRERVKLASDQNREQMQAESDRAQAISGRLACAAITARDWAD